MKTIALVAHDGKKQALLQWVCAHKAFFADKNLVATGTTGKLIAEALQQHVQCLASGPLGGDQQIGAMIAEQKIDWLVFFWDPFEQQPHDPDIKALLRVAAVWNIPVACNESSNVALDRDVSDLMTDLARCAARFDAIDNLGELAFGAAADGDVHSIGSETCGARCANAGATSGYQSEFAF